MHHDCITPTVKHPVSVMISVCMTSKDVGRISVMNGNIKYQEYIKEILDIKLKSSTHDIFQDNQAFILQHDSTPYHMVTVHKKWF